jgi:hypothetical protein
MNNLGWDKIEKNAIAFSRRWKNCDGKERQEAVTFEKDFMSIFGVDWHEGNHEYPVKDIQGKNNYIDYILPGKILIEMKSKGESLIIAYNRGMDYLKCLKPEEYPELLMVSDFENIQVTNLKSMKSFNSFKLSQLKKYVRMFGILAGYNSEVDFKTDIEVNTEASYKLAELHDRLKENGYVGENLEQYLVRILFCLFAEDTGIFEEKSFENYIKRSEQDGSDLSSRLMELFKILDIPESERMINMPNELKKFRYIDGSLFAKDSPPAYFDTKMRQTLLYCCKFDWSFISPAIFGAMFQGVMDEKERREMGAHYTSEENIMKIIKPLFLYDLWDEFERKKYIKTDLLEFHNKLTKLKFLDPACGCGNFLIIIYRELRLLEFEILKMLYDNKQITLIEIICTISLSQFFGIEYKEFPCQVAQVGLLLMKHQMDKVVSNYFGFNLIDFPIKEKANIVHGNALRVNWNSVVQNIELSYIIGNPPFVGKKYQDIKQKEDLIYVFGKKFKDVGKLDYVTAWFKKAAEYIDKTDIKVALVSTNSIVQGEIVSTIWKPILNKYSIAIDFAYKSFKWSNDAKKKAAVHCVIIGFSQNNKKTKIIYDDNQIIRANNINPYLLDAPNVFIESRSKPICDVPPMYAGNKPVDYNTLKIEESEYNDFIKNDPLSLKYIRRIMGSYEFINNKIRFCLWLKDCPPNVLRQMPNVVDRVEACRKARINSGTPEALRLSETPSLFRETMNPTNYLIIPAVSSEKRKYIPIGFQNQDVIPIMSVLIIPNATLYHFGVLTSNIHMVWMRTVAGRLKSDFRYSKDIVYNNFPWPDPTDKQKRLIELRAQKVLNVRASYKDCSLADLYDPISMKPDLLKAHIELDREVNKAYGTLWKTENKCISELMKMYEAKISDNNINRVDKII